MRYLLFRLSTWWNLRQLVRKGLIRKDGEKYYITPLGIKVAKAMGMPMATLEDFRR